MSKILLIYGTLHKQNMWHTKKQCAFSEFQMKKIVEMPAKKMRKKDWNHINNRVGYFCLKNDFWIWTRLECFWFDLFCCDFVFSDCAVVSKLTTLAFASRAGRKNNITTTKQIKNILNASKFKNRFSDIGVKNHIEIRQNIPGVNNQFKTKRF